MYSAVPTGLVRCAAPSPSVETLGYIRLSLRDTRSRKNSMMRCQVMFGCSYGTLRMIGQTTLNRYEKSFARHRRRDQGLNQDSSSHPCGVHQRNLALGWCATFPLLVPPFRDGAAIQNLDIDSNKRYNAGRNSQDNDSHLLRRSPVRERTVGRAEPSAPLQNKEA